MKIDRSVFLVTGGASGLGAATVRHLVRHGARVVVADLNEVGGHALTTELGEHCRFAKVNVTEEDDVRQAINCAGVANAVKVLGKDGPQPLEVFARVIGINLIGSFNVIRLAAEAMASQSPNDEGERGVLINTASIAAFDGQIGQASYAASKAGVVGMTLPIARELARQGIRIVTIAPGLFETPLLAGLPKEAQESLGKSVPFPSRLGRPSEFAQLVQSIIENPMLNGETIRLDGALRMAPK
jgi:NAD(P)-dependent dehydrogenase (short-subunit alcohol dehydrogenase family)